MFAFIIYNFKKLNENTVLFNRFNINYIIKDLKGLTENRKETLNVYFLLNESTYQKSMIVQILLEKSDRILFLSIVETQFRNFCMIDRVIKKDYQELWDSYTQFANSFIEDMKHLKLKFDISKSENFDLAGYIDDNKKNDFIEITELKNETEKQAGIINNENIINSTFTYKSAIRQRFNNQMKNWIVDLNSEDNKENVIGAFIDATNEIYIKSKDEISAYFKMTTDKYDNLNGEKKSLCEKLVLVLIDFLKKENI